MPLKRSTFKSGDIIEILQPETRRWAVYVGDGNFVDLTGRIIGSGAVRGESNVVEKTTLEKKGCKDEVINIYHDLKPVPNDEKTALQMTGQSKPYGSNCQDFAFELKYAPGNLDIKIRNMMPISGDMTIAAAKIVGLAVNSSSISVGSVAAKGIDLAGQGVTAISGVLGAAAGKSLAGFGNMLSAGAPILAPIVAAKVNATGYGTTFLTAAKCMEPLAESLTVRSAEVEEATANNVKPLGSYISSSSSAAGSAVATGLSWLGSVSAAGASSLLSYLRSGTEQANVEKPITTEQPKKA